MYNTTQRVLASPYLHSSERRHVPGARRGPFGSLSIPCPGGGRAVQDIPQHRDSLCTPQARCKINISRVRETNVAA